MRMFKFLSLPERGTKNAMKVGDRACRKLVSFA